MLIYTILLLLCILAMEVLAGRTLRALDQSYFHRRMAERALINTIELIYLLGYAPLDYPIDGEEKSH